MKTIKSLRKHDMFIKVVKLITRLEICFIYEAYGPIYHAMHFCLIELKMMINFARVSDRTSTSAEIAAVNNNNWVIQLFSLKNVLHNLPPFEI
jgi:hypothetical protein